MYGEISDPWWSNFTVAGFHNRSQCLVEQYNKYPVGEDNNGQPLFVRISPFHKYRYLRQFPIETGLIFSDRDMTTGPESKRFHF